MKIRMIGSIGILAAGVLGANLAVASVLHCPTTALSNGQVPAGWKVVSGTPTWPTSSGMVSMTVAASSQHVYSTGAFKGDGIAVSSASGMPQGVQCGYDYGAFYLGTTSNDFQIDQPESKSVLGGWHYMNSTSHIHYTCTTDYSNNAKPTTTPCHLTIS